MKKIYLMLLMMCTICAFSACSDDETKEDLPESGLPIANLKVPAFGEVGSDVTVRGRGFTTESQLFLEDLDGERTAVAIKTFTKEDLVFTVSEEVIGGTYTVILIQNGEWELGGILLTAKSPISDLSVPAEIAAGKHLFITGTGFAENCQVYLETKDGQRTDIEDVEVTDKGISFLIPEDFEPNNYTVYLDQRGLWMLGIVKVLAPGPKPLSRVIVFFDEGYGGGLQEDYRIEFAYDENDRLISMIQGARTWKISYPSDTKIKIETTGIAGWMGETVGTDEYVLENGVAKSYHSVSSYEWDNTSYQDITDYTFEYDGAGFLKKLSGTSVTKADGAISESSEIAFSYAMGGTNLTTISYVDEYEEEIPFNFGYTTNVSNSTIGIDLWALCLKDMDEQFPDVNSRILGIAGKRLSLLPDTGSTVMFDWEMPYIFTYKVNAVGQITEIRRESLDAGSITLFTLEYD